MHKIHSTILLKSRRYLIVLVAAVTVLGSFAGTRMIGAQSLQQQINELTAENNQNKAQLSALKIEASSYQDTINELSAQINAFQSEINRRQAESEELQRQIVEKEIELEKQRALLGKNIKAMYLEGDISTIEMLATSKSLSDYFDKQQYREVVKNKIKTTLDKITALKMELQTKREEVQKIIKQQEELRAASAIQKAEQDRLLGMNQSQQADFNKEIKETQSQINELKRKQAIENARLFGGGGGQVGGGGYPWGRAPCLHGGQVQGYCYDYEWGYNGSYYNWSTGGYAFRNCTDYVAWRTGAPGGLGNAKSWDDRAPSYGLTVSSTPREGAAAVSNSGYYGHVMYVEAVNGDGSIVISDYNRAGPGEYGVSSLSASTASNLRYVYF
jgi:surface antigen/peptidoglycan hydrolase CwlO-like protein